MHPFMYYRTHSPNYDYIVATARELAATERPRVLDFGCGVGTVIELGLSQGLDMEGVDTCEGWPADWRDYVPVHVSERIHEVVDKLPFPDASFDVVVSNQVFEHIADPQAVLPEIRRVLKPGGALLALFPVKETWYEGHVGLYFAHHLQPYPRLLRAYLAAARRLGFGLHTEGKAPTQWADDLSAGIRTTCFYHRRRDINRWWAAVFGELPQCRAADYVAFRLRGFGHLIPTGLRRLIAHVRAGVVLSVANRRL